MNQILNPNLIEEMLEKVQKPSRYTGGEMNTAIKKWDEAQIHFAFCFPDTYEVAMSHIGMKILYGLINEQPDALCERVCMPWVDMRTLMKENNVPLFSLESRTPLNQFEMVGFTLQYEMSYTNILDMLSLGGIPIWADARGEDDPIVVAGGPCAYTPEPLYAFIDAFLIGDGEEATLEMLDVVKAHRRNRTSRAECLKALAQIQGVYVPAFYDASYHPDGTLASFTPNTPDVPPVIEKRIVKGLDGAYYPDAIPVPYTEIVHDRIMLEIMRGCTRGCRFCQAGILYRPVRERTLDTLVETALRLEKNTGYEEMSLSSLSTGDYSCLGDLVRELIKRFEEKHVALSLPSLRLDGDLKETLEQTQRVKKSGLTFAPEAGTQRLRDVINKGITEEDLIRTLSDAFEGGWSSVKLYFMIGLPTETTEDLDGIADLALKAQRLYFALPKGQRAKGLTITCSASTFVPKAFTPFQWEAQDTLETIMQKQAHLRGVLKIKGVTFNWHEPELSVMEACFARGDRRLANVLYRAWERGCMLDGWSEHFKFNEWLGAFEDCGLDPAFYANRVRGKDELLPWDFIDTGVTRHFLWRERERAVNAVTTPDCRGACQGCGIQRYKGVCVYADAGRV